MNHFEKQISADPRVTEDQTFEEKKLEVYGKKLSQREIDMYDAQIRNKILDDDSVFAKPHTDSEVPRAD